MAAQNYTVFAPFWHDGRLRLAGETVVLTPAAAKYLGAEIAPAPVAAAVPKPKRREKLQSGSTAVAPEGAE